MLSTEPGAGQLSPPEWVLDGCLRVVGDRLKMGFTTGKGSTGNELSSYRTAMVHFWRWRAVNAVRAEHYKFPDAYFEASARLSNTFAIGGEAAIKKSYQKVQKDMKDPKKRLQYYPAMRDVQELIDVEVPNLKNKGK